MNENQIADIWMLFKEYLDKKTQDVAAERFIDLLADYGINDSTISAAAGFDDVLDDAISYYLDQDLEEIDEDEPDYDYNEDED